MADDRFTILRMPCVAAAQLAATPVTADDDVTLFSHSVIHPYTIYIMHAIDMYMHQCMYVYPRSFALFSFTRANAALYKSTRESHSYASRATRDNHIAVWTYEAANLSRSASVGTARGGKCSE